MAKTYTLDEVLSMESAPTTKSYTLEEVQAMSDGPRRTTLGRNAFSGGISGVAFTVAEAMGTPEGRAEARNLLVGGPLRGVTNIGNTILRGKSWIEDQLFELINGGRSAEPSPFGAGQRERMDSQDKFFRENFNPSSPAFKTGQIGTEIAGTLGVPQVVAAPVRALAGGTRGGAALANAIESAGMRTGVQLGRTADLGVRTVGGGIAGASTVGMVDPENMGIGAAIGGVFPGAMQGVKEATRLAGAAARAVRPAPGVSGADVRAARDIARMAGAESVDDIARVRDALRQQGPNIIPGSPTVPEILQHPGVSQLQRSVSAVSPAPFTTRTAEREAARREVLERIAPIGNRSEVALEVGDNIAEFAVPADNAARERVSRLFQSVDPFNESRVLLPIGQMEAATDRFLGRGTFGSGRAARQAVDEATRIGTIDMPNIRPVRGGQQPQDILQAIRRLGGINPASAGGMSREIAELGRRQTGTTGLVSQRGRTIDQVAELMHERGFIASPDPAELLDAIRGGLSGQRTMAADVGDDALRAMYERGMGDVPDAARQLQPVSFDELQNLRSSITEAWAEANRFGRTREAAALDAQRRAIDQQLNRLVAGQGAPEEFFDRQMRDTYLQARQAHAMRQQQFRTGPQAAMFRQGGDGLPVAQGGRIPPRFFNPSTTQAADAQAFRRLVQDDPRLMSELRRYAISDAAGQVDRFGNLTAAKFNRWLDQRQAAIGEVFTSQQRAWLRAIADDLRRADTAESLGRSSNSQTAQLASSMMRLGLWDGSLAHFLANRVPFGSNALGFLTAPVRQAKAERFAGLLNDPVRTGGLLDTFVATQQPKGAGLLAGAIDDPLLMRGAPLLLSGGGR